MISLSPNLAWKDPDSIHNVKLNQGDTIYLFNNEDLPKDFIDALDELNFNFSLQFPTYAPHLQAPSNHPIFLELLDGYVKDTNSSEGLENSVLNQAFLNQSDINDPYSFFSNSNAINENLEIENQDYTQNDIQIIPEQERARMSSFIELVDNNILDKKIINGSTKKI